MFETYNKKKAVLIAKKPTKERARNVNNVSLNKKGKVSKKKASKFTISELFPREAERPKKERTRTLVKFTNVP
jgi:hypothetical protein